MVQNRKKLIELFIGNISNAVVHEILEKATNEEEISSKYQKEINVSFNKEKNIEKRLIPSTYRFQRKM